MGEVGRIQGFLATVRRRVLWQTVGRALPIGGSAAFATLLLLSLAASRVGPAGFWPGITTLSLAAVLAAAGMWLVGRTAWRLRSARGAAVWVGRLEPALASDLLSAVELAAADPSRFSYADSEPSPILVHAFQGTVVTRLSALDPRRLLPMRPVWRDGLWLLGAAVVFALANIATPALSYGFALLLHRPTRFEGAAVSPMPLVGDIRITYFYPAYTDLPPHTVEGSTGDLSAVKGTRVALEGRPLRRTRRASLLLGDGGERGEIPAPVANGLVHAELTLQDDGSYRFWLAPLIGRPVREMGLHHINAEADRPPRVEIVAANERIELERPRPIEIGYSADDDFGLGAIDLVYRVGDQPEQRETLKDAHGLRAMQGRMLWDPSRLPLFPGARIAYHVEAKDRDAVSGAKTGSSRTLTLVIQNPQQGIEERLDRQREILDRLIQVLGDRLERQAADGTGPPTSPSAWEARAVAYASIHDTEESHLALLGQVLDDDRRSPRLGKPLRAALAGIADRLGDRLRDEQNILAALKKHGPGRAASQLQTEATEHIAEMEKDVLLLDDLIGRQRLEDLATMGRELTDAYRHLEDLLARYNASKDESLRRQLEREVSALRTQITDLAQKIAAVKSRNDVSEEWRNLPDTGRLMEQARKFDDLLAKGDSNALSKALGDLGQDLAGLQRMLDQNAESFGAERFPQENRVVADLVRRIGDLEGDQRQLAGETQGLSDKQEAAIESKLRDRMDDLVRRMDEKAEKLRQRLGSLPAGRPESDMAQNVGRAKESTQQLRRLLKERDLAEAKAEAERAGEALDAAMEHLDQGGRRRRQEQDARERAAENIGEARAMAEDIAHEIYGALPRGEDTLSPEERNQAKNQSQRQRALGERAQDLAREAARQLAKIPGVEDADKDLKGAAGDMQRASDHLEKSEAKQASGAEQQAADRLAKLRDALQERTMGADGGGHQNREPVRIPGADESQAPKAWRQELMDAMKEKAPDRFRDEVRRYYEELVR